MSDTVKKDIYLPQKTWEAIDRVRGIQTRAEWIRDAIKTALYYDAVDGAKLG